MLLFSPRGSGSRGLRIPEADAGAVPSVGGAAAGSYHSSVTIEYLWWKVSCHDSILNDCIVCMVSCDLMPDGRPVRSSWHCSLKTSSTSSRANTRHESRTPDGLLLSYP